MYEPHGGECLERPEYRVAATMKLVHHLRDRHIGLAGTRQRRQGSVLRDGRSI